MSCRSGRVALHWAFNQVFALSVSSVPSANLVRTSLVRIHQRSNTTSTRPRILRNSGPIDPKSFGPVGYVKQLKDEDIPGRTVTVINERGKRGPPENKVDVLKAIDRTKFYLVKLSGEDGEVPTCRIVPRAKIHEQERASNSTSSKQSKEHKELEIPWKAADGDIEHKLKAAREFLQEGKKVDVVLIARRPREIVKDPAQAQAIMERVVKRIQEMEGVILKVDEMSVLGKSVTMHLEDPNAKPKVKKKTEDRPAKQIEMLWSITDEDIGKKVFRIRELLTSDIPVELVITSKKKIYQVSESEGNQVISRVWAVLSSQMPDIQEIEHREGETGKVLTFYLGLKAKE